ncbi:MAG TPA: hypothetical protein PK977_03485 [Chitinophagaceae bacterium]|nr:hypothetical protein [Chitinophagaceae bacterium]HRF17198.1 hypothetical protein [Chitinophagaceae bacterium]
MRKIILLVCCLVVFIGITFMSCQSNIKEADCKDLCHKLDSGYINYLKMVDSIGALRGEKNIGAAIPVSERIGNHFMGAYQNEFTRLNINQTHYLKLSRDNIAFLYKHMIDANIDTLSFGFAKYDTTGFSIAGNLSDPVYNSRAEKMRNRNTIVIGEWGLLENGKKGPKPFSIKGIAFKFYDDWHNEDP